jgi:dihydroxyacetone kinase
MNGLSRSLLPLDASRSAALTNPVAPPAWTGMAVQCPVAVLTVGAATSCRRAWADRAACCCPAAAKAAADGAVAAAAMTRVRAGRSARLAEVSLADAPDPGAVAVAWVFEALATRG